MSKRGFPEAFRQFVGKHISSIEQIEVLLMLHADSERLWSVADISGELRSSRPSIQSRLNGLVRSGLVIRRDGDLYSYASREQYDALVVMLRQEYTGRRFSVIEMVHSRPIHAARSFAEAFRVKDDQDDDDG